jgi:hypothetical protein
LDDWQQALMIDSLGERPDGKWSAFEVGVVVPRQNGKGALAECRELAGLVLFGEMLILHSAHEYKTAAEAFLRMKALLTNNDDLRRRVKHVREAAGEQGVEFRNGARLRYVARSKGSGRGFSGDVNILDEAFALEPAHMAALMPTMSARPNPQIWYTSTPPLEPAALLAELRARGVASQGDHSGRLAYFEWSPPLNYRPTPKAQPLTLSDREMWALCNPALDIRIEPEFVEAERGALPDEEFARERLGVWPPDSSEAWGVISEAHWRAAHDMSSVLANPVALAADVTPDRRSASIAAAGRNAAGKRHVEMIEHRTGTGWVIARLVQLAQAHRPCALVIDTAGPAGSLIASLRTELDKAGLASVEVLTPSARDAASAYGSFYDGVCGEDVSGRDVVHLNQPELATALAGAKRRPLGDAWAWSRVSESVDISPLVAATNALWGYEMRGSAAPAVAPWVAYL